MRIVADVNYGTFDTKVKYAIYDYDTNTIEYISSTKLIKKVQKGYVVEGLVLRNIDPHYPTATVVDVQHTTIKLPEGMTKARSEYKEKVTDNFCIERPIYFKNIPSHFKIRYKGCDFIYEKHLKSEDKWTIFLPESAVATFKESAHAIMELLPYLPKVDVLSIQSVVEYTDTLDLSDLAPLSNYYKLDYDITANMCKSVKISGFAENINAHKLYSTLANVQLLDLSDLEMRISGHGCYLSGLDIVPVQSLILLPPNAEFLQNTMMYYKRTKKKSEDYTFDGRDGILYLGFFHKKDYQYQLKTEMAKHVLLGKSMKRMRCLVALHY